MIAIDAGCLTSGLTLAEQSRLDAVLVSHGHMDHLKDLATLADNRCQNNAPPLVIASCKQTITILKKHFFNGLLWPDFAKIPSESQPTITYRVLPPEKVTEIAGFEVQAIMVSHTIDSCAFLVRQQGRQGRGGRLLGRHRPDRSSVGGAQRRWRICARCSWRSASRTSSRSSPR